MIPQREDSLDNGNVFKTQVPVHRSAAFPPRQQARQLKVSKTNPSSTMQLDFHNLPEVDHQRQNERLQSLMQESRSMLDNVKAEFENSPVKKQLEAITSPSNGQPQFISSAVHEQDQLAFSFRGASENNFEARGHKSFKTQNVANSSFKNLGVQRQNSMKSNIPKQTSKQQFTQKRNNGELVFYPQALEENKLHASIGVSDKKKPGFVQSQSDVNTRSNMARRHTRQMAQPLPDSVHTPVEQARANRQIQQQDQQKKNAAPASGELPSLVSNVNAQRDTRLNEPQFSGRQKYLDNRQGMPQFQAQDSFSKSFKVRGGQAGKRPGASRTTAQSITQQLHQPPQPARPETSKARRKQAEPRTEYQQSAQKKLLGPRQRSNNFVGDAKKGSSPKRQPRQEDKLNTFINNALQVQQQKSTHSQNERKKGKGSPKNRKVNRDRSPQNYNSGYQRDTLKLDLQL